MRYLTTTENRNRTSQGVGNSLMVMWDHVRQRKLSECVMGSIGRVKKAEGNDSFPLIIVSAICVMLRTE